MKSLVSKYVHTSLILRIAIGLVIGILLGTFGPQIVAAHIKVLSPFMDGLGTAVETMGSVFVGALKGIAPILVFVLIIASLAKAGEGIGSRFATVIMLYMLSTLLAATVAVIGSFVFQPSIPLTAGAADQAPPTGLGEVFTNLLMRMVDNPVNALITANYVGILTWAVIMGLALRKIASPNTKEVLSNLSDGVSKVVTWVIQLAPFGIMGLVCASVRENSLAIFKDYGALLLVLVGCMIFSAFVVDPLLVFLFLHKNPYPLAFRCFKQSGISAFFTRSSAANIPVNMELCEELGLEKEYYSVAIPLGATINMDGAAVTITVMSLAAAFSQGISVSIPMAIILSFVATLGACGASGVTGGSLLLIPMACSLLGISQDIAMQVVGVGFIIGVVQDSLETALNSAGDVIFAATAEFHDRAKKAKKAAKAAKEVA